MKNFPHLLLSKTWYGAAASIMAALILSSCEEQEETPPAAEPPATESAPQEPATPPTPPPPTDAELLERARTALFNQAVYVLGQKITSPEFFPELNSEVKNMLEMLEIYYAELQKKSDAAHERTRLALLIASTKRDLGAYGKAEEAYKQAMKEAESLPEELAKQAEGQRLLSAGYNGLASCMLAQGKTTEALPLYEKALELDKAQYDAVAPAEGEELPEGDVPPDISKAATDLLDAYRCLGDCQLAVDDPEEARETYAKGQKVVQQLKKLSSGMSISYVKLLTSIGNLDNRLGREKEAFASWVMAARICQGLNANSPKLEVKAETKRCFESLAPAIQALGSKLQAAEKDAAEKAAEEEAAKAKAEQEAAEKAAAEEAARKAEEEQKAAQAAAQTEKKNNRRRRRR